MDPIGTSLTTLVTELRSGRLELKAYLRQLQAHFQEREPEVLAFVPEMDRFQRLEAEAVALLTAFPDPDRRPPLFGIPIGIKDIFQVDGFTTRAGSRLPAAVLQGEEAVSVSRLRAAGALVLGKTVTTEFAYFAPGPTRNPFNSEHTPGGSSSGSAAAVGANLAPLTLGTQTIGSVNRPAAYCGVVGYKPSYDRIPKSGVIPLATSVDHVGCFTTDVAGMQLVAGLLGSDWQETAVAAEPLLLGIPEGPYLARATDEGLSHFRQVCAALQEAGIVVKSVPALPDFAEIYDRHNLIVAAEAALFHAPWFTRYRELYDEKNVELIERGQSISDDALLAALAGRARLRQTLTALMTAHELDAWVSPPARGAAPSGLASTGDPVMNLPWTHSGLPSITLPAGLNEAGLPLGVQLVGHWYQDEALLAGARQVEAALSRL